MGTRLVREKFASMGARLDLRELSSPYCGEVARLTVSVRADSLGQYFELAYNARRPAVLRVLDVRPRARRLLLMVDDAPEVPPSGRAPREKFLFAHQERHWFVVVIPQSSGASNVAAADAAIFAPTPDLEIDHRFPLRNQPRP